MADTKRVPPQHPLAEVFGFSTDNYSPEAQRHRRAKLCPYHNKVPNCTKDKALDPLGVCSIYNESGEATITCPIRSPFAVQKVQKLNCQRAELWSDAPLSPRRAVAMLFPT